MPRCPSLRCPGLARHAEHGTRKLDAARAIAHQCVRNDDALAERFDGGCFACIPRIDDPPIHESAVVACNSERTRIEAELAQHFRRGTFHCLPADDRRDADHGESPRLQPLAYRGDREYRTDADEWIRGTDHQALDVLATHHCFQSGSWPRMLGSRKAKAGYHGLAAAPHEIVLKSEL